MRSLVIGLGVGAALALALAGCGTYQDLTPGARSVTATTARPSNSCKSLGSLTGKGGGASGGYVSNESLIEYAINDLRNQAAELGATHVVYSSPTMGGNAGTTTSAMVMGEALRCEPGDQPSTPQGTVTAAKSGGCEYDTQCKGDRVCVKGQCVSPATAAAAPASTTATAGAAPAAAPASIPAAAAAPAAAH